MTEDFLGSLRQPHDPRPLADDQEAEPEVDCVNVQPDVGEGLDVDTEKVPIGQPLINEDDHYEPNLGDADPVQIEEEENLDIRPGDFTLETREPATGAHLTSSSPNDLFGPDRGEIDLSHELGDPCTIISHPQLNGKLVFLIK